MLETACRVLFYTGGRGWFALYAGGVGWHVLYVALYAGDHGRCALSAVTAVAAGVDALYAAFVYSSWRNCSPIGIVFASICSSFSPPSDPCLFAALTEVWG